MNSRLLNVVAKREGSANGLLLYITDVHRKALVAFLLRGRSITAASDHLKTMDLSAVSTLSKTVLSEEKKQQNPWKRLNILTKTTVAEMLFPKLFFVDSVCAQLKDLIFFTDNLNSASNCLEEHFKPKQFLPCLFVSFFLLFVETFGNKEKINLH